MMDNQDKINQLLNKLETLLKKQDDFSREIKNLGNEIDRLKTSGIKQATQKEEIEKGYFISINKLKEVIRKEKFCPDALQYFNKLKSIEKLDT